MAFLSRDSRDSRVGVPKSRPAGLPGLWSPITLRPDLGSKCSLKQSCSSRRELSNRMSHVFCSQVFRVDSRLFLVGSQTGISTPGPSFGHNLCFRCPNEQCEPILDIYVRKDFQWYKERHKTLSFDPSNRSLKFWESIGSPSPKAGVALGVWGFTPGTLSYTLGSPWCDSRASLWPAPLQPFCLGREPKARVMTIVVVPFTILVNGHETNVSQASLQYATYGMDRFTLDDPLSILFISMERATTPRFVELPHTLNHLQKLHSVVVDEVHLLLLYFKLVMKHMLSLWVVGCQLITLTTSLSPFQETYLKIVMSTTFSIIWMLTVRPLIGYVVNEVVDVDNEIIQQLIKWLQCIFWD